MLKSNVQALREVIDILEDTADLISDQLVELEADAEEEADASFSLYTKVTPQFSAEKDFIFVNLEYAPAVFNNIVHELIQALISKKDFMIHLVQENTHYYSTTYTTLQRYHFPQIDGQTANLLDYPEFAAAWEEAKHIVSLDMQAQEGV